jgi:glutaredoxin 3
MGDLESPYWGRALGGLRNLRLRVRLESMTLRGFTLARLLASCTALRVMFAQSQPALYAAAAPRATLVQMAAAGLEDQIKKTIGSTKVVVYSKSYCPYCAKTKALFDSMDVKYTAIELDLMDDGPKVQEALLSITGQKTVPNVFVGGKHVGGNDGARLPSGHCAC